MSGTVGQRMTKSERRRLTESVIESNYKGGQLYAPLKFKDVGADDGFMDPVTFRGMANVGGPDLGDDIVDPEAFGKHTLTEFLKFGRQLLFMHSMYSQVGEITDAEVVTSGKQSMWGVTEGGLMVKGFVDSPIDEELGVIPDHELAKVIHFARMQVRRGRLKLLSIGWRPTKTEAHKARDPRRDNVERTFRRVKALILGEISLVTMAMSPQSMIEADGLRKAFQGMYGETIAEALFCDDATCSETLNKIPEKVDDLDINTIRRVVAEAATAAARKIAVSNGPEKEKDEPKYRVVHLDEQGEKRSRFRVVSLEGDN